MNPGPDHSHPESTIHVDFSSYQSHILVDTGRLRDLARSVLLAEGVSRASLSISLIDDAAIEPLNQRFLNHNGPTDVITFPLSEPDDPELSGEILISAETAAREAAARGLNPTHELSLYLIHGLLHLCGHDDHDESDRRRMFQRQDSLLARLADVGDAP